MNAKISRTARAAALGVGCFLASQPAGANYIYVDTFSSTQILEITFPTYPSGPATNFAVTNTTVAIGGQREVSLIRTNNTASPISAVIASSLSNGITMSIGTTPIGMTRLVWDGTNESTAGIDYTGLNSLDLTDGGSNNTFWVRGGADVSGGRFVVTVYSSSNNYSQIALSVPAGTQNEGNFTNFYFAFTSMTPNGTGADFTDVNAIVFDLNGLSGAGIDMKMNLFVAIPEAGSWWAFALAAPTLVLLRRRIARKAR